jgi:Outer membrane protein beta-barrel domain
MSTRTLAGLGALGILAIAASGSALADESGFYAGFDVGIASRPDPLKLDSTAEPLVRERTDNSDFAWSLVIGYHFNRYLALEAGVTDLGAASTALVEGEGEAEVVRSKLSVSAQGATLAMLAHLPSGNWDPFFKVGVMQSTVKVRGDARIGDSQFSGSEQSKDPVAFAGVGVRYAFREEWVVSFSLDYYIGVMNIDDIGRADVLSPRIGFAHRF